MLFHMRSHERLLIVHVFFWGTFVAHRWKRPPPWEDFCAETLQADDNLQICVRPRWKGHQTDGRKLTSARILPNISVCKQWSIVYPSHFAFLEGSYCTWCKMLSRYYLTGTHKARLQRSQSLWEKPFSPVRMNIPILKIFISWGIWSFYLKEEVLSQRQELPFSFYLSPDNHEQAHPFGMPAMSPYRYYLEYEH